MLRRHLAALLLGLLSFAPAGSLMKDFQRRWAEAGADDAKKKAALDALLEADKTKEAAEILLAVALSDAEDPTVIDLAIRHLAALEGHPGDAFVLQTLARSGKWQERAVMARAVSYRSSPAIVGPLSGALDDKQWQVAAAAILGLSRLRVKESVEALLSGFEKLDLGQESARRLAGDYIDALERLTGQKLATAQDFRNWWTQNKDRAKLDGAGDKAGPVTTREGVTAERAPRLFDEIRSRRVIFILDISASMQIPTGAAKDAKHPGGLTRFEVMRQEAKRVIEELDPDAKFNVIAFSDAALSWKPKLVVASESNKTAAHRFVDQLKPVGQTNSFGALEAAFADREVDSIYFLSDGFPTGGRITDYTKICAEVQKWNVTRNVRVHTIAFLAGDGTPLRINEGNKSMPKAFMSQLAAENGGHYKLVE